MACSNPKITTQTMPSVYQQVHTVLYRADHWQASKRYARLTPTQDSQSEMQRKSAGPLKETSGGNDNIRAQQLVDG